MHNLTKNFVCLFVLFISCTMNAQITFSNPVIYSDVPDMDAVRVGNDYWMVSTTMHFCRVRPLCI